MRLQDSCLDLKIITDHKQFKEFRKSPVRKISVICVSCTKKNPSGEGASMLYIFFDCLYLNNILPLVEF